MKTFCSCRRISWIYHKYKLIKEKPLFYEQKSYLETYGRHMSFSWNNISAFKTSRLFFSSALVKNGGKTVSSKNGIEQTGQLPAEESNWTTFSYHIQKWTHYELKA